MMDAYMASWRACVMGSLDCDCFCVGAGTGDGLVVVEGFWVDLEESLCDRCMSRMLFLFSKNDSATPGRRCMFWTLQVAGRSSARSWIGVNWAGKPIMNL